MIAVSLFFTAFLAATILPFSSEVALFAAVEAGLDKETALIVASFGNILAIIFNYYLGYFLYEKTKDKLLNSKSGKNSDGEFASVTLEQLLKESDIISIHAPLNDATKNLLDYEQLLTCKQNAVILNLGRGGIINEEAVAKIIDERELFFGLDVLTKEPIDIHDPLLGVKNRNKLLITPHIAWTSKEAREALIAGVIENIRSF